MALNVYLRALRESNQKKEVAILANVNAIDMPIIKAEINQIADFLGIEVKMRFVMMEDGIGTLYFAKRSVWNDHQKNSRLT